MAGEERRAHARCGHISGRRRRNRHTEESHSWESCLHPNAS